jgi:hypothetical protein
MLLLNVVGITSTYTTFNASFAFLHAENKETYAWAMEQFSEVVTPKVLCTDRKLALMNRIARVFPSCHNILYCWHINKNVLAHLPPYSILCNAPRRLHPNGSFSRDSQVGVPKLSRNCPETVPGGVPGLWELITPDCQVSLGRV